MAHATPATGKSRKGLYWALSIFGVVVFVVVIWALASSSAAEDDAPFSPNARTVGGQKDGDGNGGGDSATNPPAPTPVVAQAVVAKWASEELTSQVKAARPMGRPSSEKVAGHMMKPGDSCNLHMDSTLGFTEWVYLSPSVQCDTFGWLADGVEAQNTVTQVTVPAEDTGSEGAPQGHFIRYEQISGRPQPARMVIATKAFKPGYGRKVM